jgi:diacylglycerol kinase (ATP)
LIRIFKYIRTAGDLPLNFARNLSGTIQLPSVLFDLAMRKAALLYNPDSGGSRKRLHELESALAVLQRAGVEAELIAAQSALHAEEATRQAIAGGCDTVFACGGDGTIHNIVQVLAHSPAALAILPMGTANALAHDMGIPRNAVAAAEMALNCTRRRVALGHVEYTDMQGNPGARYFVVTAGIGVDAHLFYKLHTSEKQRMGMSAYYTKAWTLWFTYSMTRFVAEYIETGSTETRTDDRLSADCELPKTAEVTELLAVRIRNFGGVVKELAPGASLDRDDMRLVFAHTASRLAYLAYVARGLLGARWKIPGVDLVYSTQVSCRYRTDPSDQAGGSQTKTQRIYIEADGELLGMLPAEITVVPNALTLLAPSR